MGFASGLRLPEGVGCFVASTPGWATEGALDPGSFDEAIWECGVCCITRVRDSRFDEVEE